MEVAFFDMGTLTGFRGNVKFEIISALIKVG